MPTQIRMHVAADPDARFRRVTDQLRQAGRGDLQRAMVARIRRRGQPAVRAAQQSMRSATLPARPSRGGGKSTGLRDRAARAIGLSATPSGVRIRVDGSKVDPAYGTSLVLALNGQTRLRHPVFGNTSAWVQQRGPRERFYSSLEPFAERWRADVADVLEDFARKLGG